MSSVLQADSFCKTSFCELIDCRDISAAGLQKGLAGSRSSLIAHVWRVADALPKLQLGRMKPNAYAFGSGKRVLEKAFC